VDWTFFLTRLYRFTFTPFDLRNIHRVGRHDRCSVLAIMRQEYYLTIEVNILNNFGEYFPSLSSGNAFHGRLWRRLYNIYILYIIYLLQMLYNIYNNSGSDRILLTWQHPGDKKLRLTGVRHAFGGE